MVTGAATAAGASAADVKGEVAAGFCEGEGIGISLNGTLKPVASQ